MPADSRFADYCCELLASAGPCRAKRMFGGWGISIDTTNIYVEIDLEKKAEMLAQCSAFKAKERRSGRWSDTHL